MPNCHLLGFQSCDLGFRSSSISTCLSTGETSEARTHLSPYALSAALRKCLSRVNGVPGHAPGSAFTRIRYCGEDCLLSPLIRGEETETFSVLSPEILRRQTGDKLSFRVGLIGFIEPDGFVCCPCDISIGGLPDTPAILLNGLSKVRLAHHRRA